MKLEIETENFPALVKGFNNAIIAYQDIRNAIWLMGGIPEGVDRKWEILINHDARDINDITSIFDERLKELYKIYEQLIGMENGIYL